MRYNFLKIIFLSMFLSMLLLNNVFPAHAIQTTDSISEESVDAAIQKGLDYIATQVNDDGGIRWMDDSSSVAATIRVVLALSANLFPQDMITSQSGMRPIDFLSQNGEDWVFQREKDTPAFSPSRAGQLLTAVAAGDENPHAFGIGPIDLIYELKAHYDTNNEAFTYNSEITFYDQVWPILGLATNHASIPEGPVQWLVQVQSADGSWDDGFGNTLDATPLAMMALIASGQYSASSTEIQKSINFLHTTQEETGGWQTEWDTTTNANTTGMILQAIASLDDSSIADLFESQKISQPASALLAIQQETGAIGGDFANAYSTAEAILGLSGQPLFILGSVKRINLGFDYLVQQQAEDGGWGTVGQTVDVMLALRSAGWDPLTVQKNGNTPLQFLERNLESYIESGPDAVAKAIIAAVISRQDPTDFFEKDLVENLWQTYDENTGAFGDSDNTWHQALPILALNAAYQDFPNELDEHLINLQLENGGWEYSKGFGSSPDTTALVLQALVALGYDENDKVIFSALDYLKDTQNTNGGWEDSSSTSYVMTALTALGKSEDNWRTKSDRTPSLALLSYQKANGAFFYNETYPDENLMSTASALFALTSGSMIMQSLSEKNVNYAGLLISLPNNEIQTACVPFTEGEITGLELLELSGFEYEMQEGFMNSILGQSNPEGDTLYWSYWHWDGREWIFKTTGAGDSIVQPGSIEGWHLTSWEIFPSLPPRAIPITQEFCSGRMQKNYQVQPFINHSDLKSVDQNFLEAENTSANLQEDPQQENATVNSPIPLFIIIGFGVLLVILFLVIILRRKK